MNPNIWHIWIAGNASAPLSATTKCGTVGNCSPNREDATCGECVKIFKEEQRQWKKHVESVHE